MRRDSLFPLSQAAAIFEKLFVGLNWFRHLDLTYLLVKMLPLHNVSYIRRYEQKNISLLRLESFCVSLPRTHTVIVCVKQVGTRQHHTHYSTYICEALRFWSWTHMHVYYSYNSPKERCLITLPPPSSLLSLSLVHVCMWHQAVALSCRTALLEAWRSQLPCIWLICAVVLLSARFSVENNPHRLSITARQYWRYLHCTGLFCLQVSCVLVQVNACQMC